MDLNIFNMHRLRVWVFGERDVQLVDGPPAAVLGGSCLPLGTWPAVVLHLRAPHIRTVSVTSWV